MIKINDEILLGRAKEGDKAAFEEFYQRYKGQIFTYIYRFVNNYQVAEELTQETFINAYTHLDSYSPKGKPLAWIYAIASNLSKNTLKNKRLRSEVSLDAPMEVKEGQLNMLDVLENFKEKPDTTIRGKELASKIKDAFDALPAAHKQVLLLCDVQGHTYQDVAYILGCKLSTVGSRLFRARKKIAKKLAMIYKEKPRKISKWKDVSFLRKDYPST